MIISPKVLAGLLMAFGASFQIGFRYTLNKKSLNIDPPTEQERREAFDKKSSTIDKELDFDEWFFGIKNWRSKLIENAKGSVLEVAAGTGRNFPFYNPEKVKTLTIVDASRPSLKVAVDKKSLIASIPTKFIMQNALKLSFEDNTFDTIVDTFGICSFEYPVETLRELGRVLKNDGRILFLEHGLSNYSILNNYMKSKVGFHAHKHGCYYNRNIIDIIKEAGFIVDHCEQRTFGTIYLIIAHKPNPGDESQTTPETENK